MHKNDSGIPIVGGDAFGGAMTRTDLLEKLHSIDCSFFLPGNWDDVGYTEQQMWVNSKGYGCYTCDHPNIVYKAKSIPFEKWKEIRSAVKNGILTEEKIAGTSLAEICFFEEDNVFSEEWLKHLLDLPEQLGEYYYCADSLNGPMFFNTEEQFLDYLKRDWCEVC